MGGISLKGAQSPFVRGVSISGFSIGINADNSVSAQFPDLSVAQLITVMHVMKTLQADESKNGSDLEKISKTLSGGSKLAEVASRVWGNFFLEFGWIHGGKPVESAAGLRQVARPHLRSAAMLLRADSAET